MGRQGKETPKRTERNEAAVAETFSEATALKLLKFHFMKPHLSLLKYRSFLY